MESGMSTVRNLLYVVLALVVLAILSNFFVATQLARNSDELASLRLLLQKELTGSALTQAQELQKRMDALNESANGIDAKLQKAQDQAVARMQVEIPRIMDNYVRQRMPMVQREVARRGAQIPK